MKTPITTPRCELSRRVRYAFAMAAVGDAFGLDTSAQLAAAPPAEPLYPNLRAPLQETRYVRLPLPSIKPRGWLRDQLVVQANGTTGHLHEVWDAIGRTAWKGDRGDWTETQQHRFGDVTRTTSYAGTAGLNMYPECCWARFVPRWLEGLLPLAHQLDDAQLQQVVEAYMHELRPRDLHRRLVGAPVRPAGQPGPGIRG